MKTSSAIVAGLAAVASAVPTASDFNKIWSLAKRQNAAAQAMGISDVDILQLALTLEWLETEFYRQAPLAIADFDAQGLALGLSQEQVQEIKDIEKTEEAHVTLLQSAIAQAGVQPVEQCEYNFGFTTVADMVGVAGVLEQVGVSAYLGAAPLLADTSILATAGSILTIEARHQTLIRAFAGTAGVPAAFDTPLGPRSVFSLAAPFVVSCPEGSNLILQPFPALTLNSPAAAADVAINGMIRFNEQVAGATHCAFQNGGAPGGTIFTEFTDAAGCVVPQNIAGITYVSLSNAGPITGVLTDDMILAGPLVLPIS